jgi:hypothetical protein
VSDGADLRLSELGEAHVPLTLSAW